MPSTLIHALLPGGCAAYQSARPTRWQRFLTAAMVANLPDLDIALGLALPAHFNQIHRMVGHNVFIFPLWVALGAWLLKRWGGLPGKQSWWASALLVTSHLWLDSMTVHQFVHGTVSTVPLLWPVSNWGYEFPLRVFAGVPPQQVYKNPLVDRIWSAEFWEKTVFLELFWTAVFFAAWVAVSEAITFGKKRKRAGSNAPGPSSKLAS